MRSDTRARIPISLAGALLLLGALPSFAGHPLQLGVTAAHLDFDEDIRFEDDLLLTLEGAAELLPGWTLGVELGRVTARDRERDHLEDLLLAGIRSRYAFRPQREWSPWVGAAVSFTVFEDAPDLDSVSEGFDLGAGGRFEPVPDWQLRAGFWVRLQTIKRVEVDALGVPTGRRIETGYLWSRLFSLGVARAF